MTEPLEPTKPEAIAAELGALLGRDRGPDLLELARTNLVLSATARGTSTSEFRMSLVGVGAGLALLVIGSVYAQPELVSSGLDLVQWSVAGYAISRGIAKSGVRA